jgi:hypothetical protein
VFIPSVTYCSLPSFLSPCGDNLIELPNQYLGVNAHLHSAFQAYDGWESFHSATIADLARALDRALPAGYTVDIEQSLQVREWPLYFTAIKIYVASARPGFGTPVTLIEVLSPGNKRGGTGYAQYREKRYTLLNNGLRLVEIDYLHESASPLRDIPVYPHETGSHPYTITVSDPFPSLRAGISATYAFDVDQPIPTIALPLAGDETIPLDLDRVYQTTFESLRAYSLRVDYASPPANFARYSEGDQARIRRRMACVLAQAEAGTDLETGPFPLLELTE